MAANHIEYVEAHLASTNRLSIEACQRWMNAKTSHPLYQQLSDSRTPQDQLLLEQIYSDIEHLRQEFLDLLVVYQRALDDYLLVS
jgi:hypothetical protein